MHRVFVLLSFLSVLIFQSCKDEPCGETDPIEPQPTDVGVIRLEGDLFSTTSTEDVKSLLKSYPSVSRLFLHADQYPDYETLAGKIKNLISHPSMDTLYREAIQASKNITAFQEDMESAIGRLKTLFPSTTTPKFVTLVTGMYNDLYVSDSLVVIGLDYFIGPGATFIPDNVPYYLRRRYDMHHLPSIIVKVLAGQKINDGKEESLVSEMIDFGKTYYLASRLLPCTPDSLLLGYTSEEMNIIHENEPVIWANLVENEVLYETSHITKRRFLGERPFVYEISQKCPGRIGAWVGWRIVEQYMKRNEVDIKAMLADRDHDKIFRQSGYKPMSR